MKVVADIGIIGVPAGFYSITEEAGVPYYNFLDTFYRDDVRHAGKQMYINKRKDGWVLYTYTVGDNGGSFSSTAGRTGSFFEIVLAVNGGEFANVQSVYNLLNYVYETSVRGTIISDDGKNKKWIYKHSQFADARKIVEDSVMQNIAQFTGNKFMEFKFNPAGQNSLKYTPPHQGNTPPVAVPSVQPTKSLPNDNAEKTKQFDDAIAKLTQMGIDPNALAKYIVDKNKMVK